MSRLAQHHLFKVCAGLEFGGIYCQWNESHMLRGDGIRFDAISVMEDEIDVSVWAKIFKRWYEFANLALHDRYVTGESFDNSFLRMATLDLKFDYTQSNCVRASHSDIKIYQNWVRVLFDEKDTSTIENAQSMAVALATAVAQQRLFLTQHGYLGLGPPGIQVGDEIYIVGGSLWPLILRTAEDVLAFIPFRGFDPQPLHTFVGDCYVHGVMDGEFAKGRKDDMSAVYLI